MVFVSYGVSWTVTKNIWHVSFYAKHVYILFKMYRVGAKGIRVTWGKRDRGFHEVFPFENFPNYVKPCLLCYMDSNGLPLGLFLIFDFIFQVIAFL